MENTYQTVFEAIQKRAAQFAEAGIVGYGDKVVLYKSPAFDTYLLAVAVTALGAVPVMISYHLPSSNLDVFAERLEKSFIVYDQETEERVAGVTRTDLVTIDSNLALEDVLLDKLDFLSEVVIIRDVNGAPQPIIALADDAEMNWEAWWAMVADLPLLKEAILMAYDVIPRTAAMKVQRRNERKKSVRVTKPRLQIRRSSHERNLSSRRLFLGNGRLLFPDRWYS